MNYETHSLQGKPYVKHANVVIGTVVYTDTGFTCMRAGRQVVQKDEKGYFLICDQGKHYLDGQLNDKGYLVGLTTVPM